MVVVHLVVAMGVVVHLVVAMAVVDLLVVAMAVVDLLVAAMVAAVDHLVELVQFRVLVVDQLLLLFSRHTPWKFVM